MGDKAFLNEAGVKFYPGKTIEMKRQAKTAKIILPQTRQVKKLKTAVYVRVSTLMASQETSYNSQIIHYKELIEANDDWEFAGIYPEAGLSGTAADNRPQLMRLIKDCEEGRVDLILTKSISRFSRSTQDCLEMVRYLTGLGVTIRFEKENINTGTMESELMLTILASFAEQESRSISGNMKWSIRKRFADGTYVHSRAPYGYTKKDKRLVIDPEQAKVVREIFSMTIEGYGAARAARELNLKGIPSPSGGKWRQSTLHHMISNPVYAGDMLCQKTYMDDSYVQKQNKGELDRYFHEGAHEAIISREMFEEAQETVKYRARKCSRQ